MPRFERISAVEARRRTAGGKRQRIIDEYIAYIDQLSADEAGRLVPSVGESKSAVRRRLGDAMRISGKYLEIKTADDGVYFWLKPRRGRRPSKPVM